MPKNHRRDASDERRQAEAHRQPKGGQVIGATVERQRGDSQNEQREDDRERADDRDNPRDDERVGLARRAPRLHRRIGVRSIRIVWWIGLILRWIGRIGSALSLRVGGVAWHRDRLTLRQWRLFWICLPPDRFLRSRRNYPRGRGRLARRRGRLGRRTRQWPATVTAAAVVRIGWSPAMRAATHSQRLDPLIRRSTPYRHGSRVSILDDRKNTVIIPTLVNAWRSISGQRNIYGVS